MDQIQTEYSPVVSFKHHPYNLKEGYYLIWLIQSHFYDDNKLLG